MKSIIRLCSGAALSLSCLILQPAASQAADNDVNDRAVQKPIKTLVGAIRYGKDDLAAQQLDFVAMGSALLGDAAQKLSVPQREEFQRLLTALLRKMSFPKGRELFKYLDAVVYSPATLQDAQMHCKSTIVVHRDMKKQELVIEWVVHKQGNVLQVVDMMTGGQSTLAAMRNEQVMPLMAQGGVDALLKAMQAKLEQAP